jgi:DNA-binding MarR family transcriptional regulator
MEGSLTGFSLKEIFEILAVTKKTGVLEVSEERGAQGKVYFKDGQLYWAETTTIDGPLPDDGAAQSHLRDRIADVLLEIFDWGTSLYRFDINLTMDNAEGTSFPVGGLLAEVVKRQAEWAEIRTEIPSLKARVELISKLAAESVSLTRSQWRIVSLIGKNATVEDLREELKVSPLAVCRCLYDMSKTGLIRCLGEVIEAEPDPPEATVELETTSLSKKYIRKSLVSEEAENAMPVEWVSYYQLLDGQRLEAKRARAGAMAEH